MTKENNKKNSIRHLIKAGLFIILTVTSFLFGNKSLALNGDYNKLPNGTLDASEWNNLLNDFVNTWQTASMVGPLSVGTNQSSSRLNVAGSIDLGIVDTSNLFRLSYNTTSGGSLQAYIAGAGSNMTLNPTAGNVGIGTTNPTAKLYVAGALQNSLATTHNLLGGVGNALVMADNTGTLYTSANPVGSVLLPSGTIGATMYHNGTIWIASTTPLYNNGTNVGIGTTAPIGKLQIGANTLSGANGVYDNSRIGTMVNGTLTSMVYASNYNSPTYPDYGLVLMHASSTSNYNVWSLSPDGPAKGNNLNFIYQANATNIHTQVPKVVFKGDGNVGVGTTNPAYKLDINGTMIARDRVYFNNRPMNNAVVWPSVYDQSATRGVRNMFLNAGDVLVNGVERGFTISANRAPSNGAGTLVNIFKPTGSGTKPSWSSVNAGNPVVITIENIPNVAIDKMLLVPGSRNSMPIDFSLELWSIYPSHGVGGYAKLINVTGDTTNYLKVMDVLQWEGIYKMVLTVTVAGDADQAGVFALDNLIGYERYIGGGRFTGYNMSVSGDTGYGNYNFMNGNVGIGLTNPAVKLDVIGAFRNSLATTHTLLGGSGNVLVMADNTGTLYTAANPVGSVLLPTGTNGQTLRNSGGTTWVANSTLFNDGTNVGIGTASPGSTVPVGLANPGNVLEIKSPTNVNGLYLRRLDGLTGLDVTNEGQNTGTVYFDSRYNNGTMGGFIFRTQTSATPINSMSIIGNGNVGIGITNPSAKFQVHGGDMKFSSVTNGSLYFGQDGNGTYMEQVGNNTGNENYRLQSSKSGDVTNYSQLTIDPTSGFTFSTIGTGNSNVGIGIAPAVKLDVSGAFRNSLATTHSLLGAAGNVVVLADNTGTLYGTPLATFVNTNSLWGGTKNGTIYNGDAGVGNVGIGTTNPIGKLSVLNTDVAGAQTMTALQFGRNAHGSVGDKDNIDFVSGATVMGRISYEVMGGGQVGTAFSTLNSTLQERMRITYDGNVGIGTTNPSTKLEVNGTGGAQTLRVLTTDATNLTAGSSLDLALGDIGWGSGMRAYVSPGQVYDWQNLEFYTSSYSGGSRVGRMTITSTGNVGIGVTNPTTKLDISGTFRNSLATTHSLLAGSGNVVVLADNTGTLYSTSLTSFVNTNSLWGGTKNGAIYNGDAGVGNVGIGITNPGEKLDVIGNIAGNAALKISSSTASSFIAGNVGIGNLSSGASKLAIFGNTSVGSGYFSNAAPANGLIVEGRVGIGTTTPAEALHVIGNVQISNGLTLGGNLNMTGNTLTVNKITANTIDPLYSIDGINYSTFASSIVGGVKEEYVGRITASRFKEKTINSASGRQDIYETVIDFGTEKEGSDLWVWHKTINFSPENVEIFVMPLNDFASIYATVKDDTIIIRSSKPVDASLRLVGKRFDWREWPTKAIDQQVKAGMIINTKK